jgi:dTDP-4-amino-4,6-dideoxygalactose transaminase
MNDDGNRWRPWRDRPLVFGAPTIGTAERDEVIACLESGWLGTGPRVAELERRLGAYLVDDSRTSVARDEVLAGLRALRIGTGIHYQAVHLHPWYRRHHGERTGTLPGAEWVSARTFSLPLSAGMSDGDVSDVARALRVIFS